MNVVSREVWKFLDDLFWDMPSASIAINLVGVR